MTEEKIYLFGSRLGPVFNLILDFILIDFIFILP